MEAEKIREIWDRIVEEESEKDTAWDMVRLRASEEVAAAHAADLATRDVELERLREALQSIQDYHLELGEHTETLNNAISTLWKIGEIAEEVLAVTPKRVLFVGTGQVRGLEKAGRQEWTISGDRMGLKIYQVLEDMPIGGTATVAVLAEGEGDEHTNT